MRVAWIHIILCIESLDVCIEPEIGVEADVESLPT
jgi:hypothetical protein